MTANDYIIKEHARILSERHLRLGKLIDLVGVLEFKIPLWHTIEDAIVQTIVTQMLSFSASKSILYNLYNKYGTSQKIIEWSIATLNTDGPLNGLSKKKRQAIFEFSRYLKCMPLNQNDWHEMPLNEFRKEIKKIWGVGNWSSDMLAIFYLARFDVWPESDVGLRRACKIVFGEKDTVDIKKIIVGCETVTALYLWEFINKRLTPQYIDHNGQLD